MSEYGTTPCARMSSRVESLGLLLRAQSSNVVDGQSFVFVMVLISVL